MPTTREDIAPGDTLQSYVPELVRRRARDVPIPERGGYRYEAAVLFADMSGFTALTEMLASRQDGAEEISRVLNAYFGRISDLVSAHGGDLLRLAGDAAVATWGRTEGRVAMHDLIASAAACALAIRDAVHGLELHGARISVRSAISCGEVLESHVGGVDGHWEFLVAGDPLVDVTEGLRRAQPGEVLVAPGSWRFIHERSEGIADRDGFVRLASAPAVELPRVGIDDAADASLRAYIPDAVLSRYDAGQTAWLAELRQVTVVFVRLSGIDYGRTDALDRIDDVLRALQTPLYRAEGAVRQFLVDDKGTVLIAAFGLPPSSHEDDAVRAVRTAIAMREAAAKRGVDTSVGITTGRVFCGPIGSGRRREYALVGDVVNVAARLMEAAPDDVLCDAETHQRARHRIAFERLPTFELKGKGTASALFRPSFGPGPGGAQQMVGRESEHGMILEAVERLRAGKGGVVLIEGEPGVGKTRLLAEALRSIGAVDVLRGHADPLERSRPYHAWVPVFDVILGVGTGDDAAIRTLLSDTELGRHAALLNSIAKVDLPETDLTREMTGQVRADNTRDLLVALLRRRAAAGPLIIAMEDAHWADSASWALLAAVAEDVRTILALVTARPMPDPPRQHADLVARGARRISLDTLPQAETFALVRQCLGVRDIAIDVVRRVHRLSAGNPLFVEELTASLRDRGLVTVVGGVCGFGADVDPERVELPSTLQGVITTRIDQLGVPEQLTLKIGAVIGPTFAYQTLHDVHPIAQDRVRLREHLDKLLRVDLVVSSASGPEGEFLFKHEITREVAYGLLTMEQRSQLHAAVASWYERERAEDLATMFPLLAHHWREAGDRARTSAYLERAGEQALRNGAYREAVAFLDEALAPPDSRPTLHRGRLERMLGESYLGLGRHAEGHEHLRRAVELLGQAEPRSLARLVPRILDQVVRQLRHRVVPRSIAIARGDDRERLLEAARAYIRLVEVHWFANRTPLLVHAGLTSLNLAERIGPSPELARAYAIMTLAAGSIPQRSLAEMYAARSVRTAREVAQLHALAYSLFITSVYAIGTAQWQRVETALAEASALFEEVGDRRLLGDARTVQAMSLLYRGEFAASEPVFAAVRAGGLRNENIQHQVWGGIGSAESLYRRGRVDEAIDRLEAVVRVLDGAPDRAEELRAQGLLAVAFDDRGETERADRAAARAAELIAGLAAPTAHYLLEGYAGVAEVSLRRAESGGYAANRDAVERSSAAMRRFAKLFPIGGPRSLLLTGRALWLRGDRADAGRRWISGLAEANRSGMRYEEARLHLELGRTANDATTRAAHLSDARVIFEEIGAARELALARGDAVQVVSASA